MCGRFSNAETIPTIARRWLASVGGELDWSPSDDIRPTQRVPVLLEGPADRPRRLGLMRWGWARDFAASGNLINARAEDMAGKRTFAESVQRRRCLVPATSWFEWQANPEGPKAKKRKHRLQPDTDEPWALAGLWETAAGDSGPIGQLVLITTAAHASIAAVHDRMPGIVHATDASTWFRGDATTGLQLLAPRGSRAVLD